MLLFLLRLCILYHAPNSRVLAPASGALVKIFISRILNTFRAALFALSPGQHREATDCVL